jgi:superfamily II DNA or RNA helicase
MELKIHQKECISNISKIFDDDEKNGLIKMFCGSGKSFVIYHSILEFGSNLSVIVVPSINLISQFNNDYLFDEKMKDYNERKFKKEFDIMTICSKNELKEKDFSKEIKLTTESDKITEFLLNEDDKLILITYQSLETLFEILEENSINVDLICFDEAHHICGEKTKELLFENEYVDEYVNKMLFFTATPVNKNNICMYNPPTEITINDENYEIIDDNNSFIDDEYDEEISHCGSMIYEYMHKRGVNDNILNDFQVRVDLYTENTDKSVFEAISRSILETGNSRVLTFHSRSETESDKGTNVNDFSKKSNLTEFKKIFDKVQKSEFPELKDKYKNIYFEGITASTPNRRKVLDNFDETKDNEIFILASCKTIGEGVDTKNANMVCFVDSKQSYVEIVQNIGRICRKNKNTKQKATVLIPAWVDKEKYKDCKGNPKERDKLIREDMNKGGNFNGILNVLSALRQEDPYIFELCLKYPEVYTLKELKDNFKKEGLELVDKKYDIKEVLKEYNVKFDNKKTEEENFNKLSKQLDVNIQITNQKILEEDIIINNKSDEWLYFVKTEDNKYMITNTKEKTKKKEKIDRPHRNIKPFCHVNPNVEVLWDFTSDVNLDKGIFGGFIEATVKVDNEAIWIEKLELVKKYIDENDKIPSTEDKNIEIKSYGRWISCQKKNYKKNQFVMKNNKIKKLWEDFINNSKYKKYFISDIDLWKLTLNNIKKYIDDNNKRPSGVDKNIKIKKYGLWLYRQKNNYLQNIKKMSNENIKKLWEEFINNPKYKQYFISNEEEWKKILNDVKIYIDNNKKLPTSNNTDNQIKIYGTWINIQKQNYKNNQYIMSNNNIRILWEEFINSTKYKIYFDSKDDIWKKTLIDVKKYIDDNKKRPSQIDKNIEIKKLGTWLGHQIKNYNKNEQIMINKEIRKQWKDFINDPKYKIYFTSNEDIWKLILNDVKKYIDLNNKKPTKHDKDNQIKTYGSWISTQNRNYSKQEEIMSNKNIRELWEEFINDPKYKIYFISNEDEWKITLSEVKEFIDKNKLKPSQTDKNQQIKAYGKWISMQQINYSNNNNSMANNNIKILWEEFINDPKYKIYFISNEDKWKITLNEIKKYIDTYNKKPSRSDINQEIKGYGTWLATQQKNYSDNQYIMTIPIIKKKWEEFITEYQQYFPENPAIQKITKKSINIIPKKNKEIKQTDEQKKQRKISEYQELTKKMSIQKSDNTNKMFKDKPELWEQYHEARDFSFQGYEQDEIPVNKIISYLETKKNHRLKILDLGCGRNLIKEHFKDNKKFTITGYDHISYNGSKVSDISNLEDEEEDTIDICVYSQSLMGSNWKEYLDEGKYILRYNGEMIISESSERYEIIKKYLIEIGMKIIKEDYNETKRWFYINVIKQ